MPSSWDRLKQEAEQAGSRGDFTTASSIWFQALEQLDNVGDEDTRLLITLDQLADSLANMGKPAQAVPPREYLVHLREKALGTLHIEVANSLNSLTELYYSMGEFEKAQPLSERIMQIYEKNFGSNHLGLAMIGTFLALIYHGQGDYDKAEEFYQIAMTIKQKVLGYNHPEVGFLMENYAGLLYATNRDDEADTLCGTVGTASGVWRLVSAQASEQLTNSKQSLKKTLSQPRRPIK